MQSFKKDDEDEGISFADIGTAVSGLEAYENDSCSSDVTETSESAKDEDDSSDFDMQEIAAALQPYIRKRIQNWEKNSMFEFSEERITKEGTTRIRGTRRDSMRFNQEEIVCTPTRAGRLDASLALPAPVRRSQHNCLADEGVQVVRRTTTTTIVEEVVTSVNNVRAEPRSAKKKKNYSDDSDDEGWTRPSPPKTKKRLPAIQGAETVLCEAQAGPSPMRPKVLNKLLRENGIKEQASDGLVLRKGDQLVFHPGSAKKEIESAIQSRDDKEDIFERLSQLRRPTLVQRLVENDENTPSKSRDHPAGAGIVTQRKSVYNCVAESSPKSAKPARRSQRQASLSGTPHKTKRELNSSD